MTKRRLAVPLLAGLIALAGCGSSSKSGSTGQASTTAGAPTNAKQGGTLTVLSSRRSFAATVISIWPRMQSRKGCWRRPCNGRMASLPTPKPG